MDVMPTMNESLHARALDAELQWFSAVMDARLSQYFEQRPDEAILQPPPPVEGSAFSEVCRELGLGTSERLVLALALAPHLRPQILDSLFVQNKNLERGFTEFGGLQGAAQGGFIPTGETAAFLVAGNSLEKRFALMQILGPSHPFRVWDILALAPSPSGEPVLSGRLVISEEWLSRLCSGTSVKPGFNSDFPAELGSTSLGREQLVLSENTTNQLKLLMSWVQHGVEWMHTPEYPQHRGAGLVASLHGPAGVGKTLTALLLGKQAGTDVYRVGLKLIGAWDTVTVRRGLDRVFKMATSRRWILLIENAGLLQDGGVTVTQASNFAYLRMHLKNHVGLTLLESRQSLAAEIDLVDIALTFEAPDIAQRLLLWKSYLPEDRTGNDVRLEDFAERYPLTGAQIATVVFQSFLYCAQRSDSLVNDSDLTKCLAELK